MTNSKSLLAYVHAIAFALVGGLCIAPTLAPAQQTVTSGRYMVQLTTEDKSIPIGGKTILDLFVMDAKSMAPISGLKITGTLDMPDMGGMDLAKPEIEAGREPGHYDITATFPMRGEYKLDLKIQPPAGDA